MATKARKMSGSLKGNRVGKKAHKLSAKDAREKGEAGSFGRHLAALLAARELTHESFALACQKAELDVQEWTVRSWLRGDSMPKAHMLRSLGKVLKLDDPRHILPE